MTQEAQHPMCAQCGSRIRLSELIWREFASGSVRGSYAADLDDRRQRADRCLWHLGCLPLERHHNLAA